MRSLGVASSPAADSKNGAYAVIGISPLSELGLCSHTPLLADVPFDFLVGDTMLRSGMYTIERTPDAGMLLMRAAAKNSPPVLIQSIPCPHIEERGCGTLLFHWYSRRYFLAQVLAAPEPFFLTDTCS